MPSPKTKKTVKTKKTAKSKKTAPAKPKKNVALKLELTEPELATAPEAEVPIIEDPIGDETDGEAKTANVDGTESEAKTEPETASAPEFSPAPGAPADGSSSVGFEPRPPAKLERLQKILAAAGVATAAAPRQ